MCLPLCDMLRPSSILFCTLSSGEISDWLLSLYVVEDERIRPKQGGAVRAKGQLRLRVTTPQIN